MPGHEAWLAKACSDLISVRKLIKDDDITLDTAAYHTQQCVEKSLKAYLVFCKISVPKTHDLTKLLIMCSQKDPAFKILLEDVAELSPYATYIRYPDDRFMIGRAEAENAQKCARKIFEFVKKTIKVSTTGQQQLDLFSQER